MGLVMFAYLLGPALFGWYGIFMGPLLMVLIVEFIVTVLPRLAGPEQSDTTNASVSGAGTRDAGSEDAPDGGEGGPPP